jgi:hypothetical protein
MRRTEIETAVLRGWPGGWRPDLADSHAEQTMLTDISNMNWTRGYGLKQRGGFQEVRGVVSGMVDAAFCLIKNVYTAVNLAAQPAFTQQVYYVNEDDGEIWNESLGNILQQELDATGADLAYSSQSIGPWGGGGSNFFRTFSVQAVTFGDKVYLTALRFGGYSAVSTPETHNGGATDASKPIKHDVLNDTFTRPIPHVLDGSATGFPSARCAVETYDRIFCANIYKQSVYRYPSRVYWSDAGTAETFQTNSYIEVGIDDGQEITQMLPYSESILIFKDRSTWVLMGTDEDTFSLYQLEPTIGCQSSTGAVSSGGNAYFFDDATGVWMYNGSDFELISRPITAKLMDTVNRRTNFKVVMAAHEDRIFLCLPVGDVDGGDTDDRPTVTYVYDTHLKTWTTWDYGWVPDMVPYVTDHVTTAVGVTSDGAVYFGSPMSQVGIFRLEGAVDDEYTAADQAVNASFTTAWLNPGDIGDRHRIRRLELMTEITANQGVITTDMYRDMKDSAAWQTATFTPAGTLSEYHHQDSVFDVKTQWSWLKLKVSNDVITKDFQVNGLGLTYSTRNFRRGVRGELNQ